MSSKKIRILSIDGGGIRGIIPGMVLAALEKEIKKQSNDPHAGVADYFDFVAGTSTGGILSCALFIAGEQGKPRFSARKAVDLYLERGDDIFHIPVWKKAQSLGGTRDEKYPAKALEKALDDYFGEARLSELLKPCLISAYDIRNANPFFFKSHRARKDYAYEFMLRDVARATSAAPTYFECANTKSFTNEEFPLIDGGVYVNNPALCAYSEVRTMTFKDLRSDMKDSAIANKYPTAKDMIIFSLGTASSSNYYSYDKAKNWGMIGWLSPLINIMMSGVSETVDFQLKQIFGTTTTPEHYIRIEPDIGNADSAMDNASDENLLKLKEAGEISARNFDRAIQEVAGLLVSNH